MHVLEENVSSGAARELIAAGQHRQQGRGEGRAIANVLGDGDVIGSVLSRVCVQHRALDERHLFFGIRVGARARVRVMARMRGIVMSCTTVSIIGRIIAHSPRLSRILPCVSKLSRLWLTWEPPVSLSPNSEHLVGVVAREEVGVVRSGYSA